MYCSTLRDFVFWSLATIACTQRLMNSGEASTLVTVGALGLIGVPGTPIKPNAPTVTSVEASPEFIKRWVQAIVANDQKTKSRSVEQYILDNEPSLWSGNHRDVHPEALSYDELLDRSIRYGSAIRAADPGALIAGPAEWGWTAYFYSPKDMASGVILRPDRRAHGDVPLLPWYLSQLREHDQATG